MSKINRYTKAMRQLRSTRLDEAVPTMSMQGIYVDTPFVVTTPPEEVITGTGADYTQDDSGGDTSGLFDANGDQLTAVPPTTIASPDNSYILGPMASMWYSWGNFSTFGYIRESDRRMVNLGSIQGPLHTWDKVSNFNSYGQLTLEQAVWFVENEKYGGVDNNYANANYRAYYPGPPSSSTDSEGRYLCTITGVPKELPSKYQPPDDFTPGTNVSGDDEKSPLRNIVPGSANPDDKDKRPMGRAAAKAREQEQKRLDAAARLAKGESITGDADTDKGLGDLWNIGRQGVQGLIGAFGKALDGIRGKGLGGTAQLGFHGTSADAAARITAPVSDLATGKTGISGFKPGSRQNIYGTKGTFWAPSGGTQSGDLVPQAAKEFSKRGGNVGRGSFERAFSGTSKTAGDIIPGVVPKGAGPGMNIPGTKWKEISSRGKTSNKAAEFGKRLMSGKYSKSAKAAQLLKTGATTASLKGGQKLGKLLGRAAPGVGIALAAADVAKRGNDARKNFANGNYAEASLDIAGALMGGLSGIPGPIGWTALGAQFVFDVSRSGVKTNQKIRGRSGAKAAQNEEFILEQVFYEGKDTNETMKGYMTLLSKALKDSLNGVGGIDPEEEEFLKILESGQLGAPEDLEMVMKIVQKLAGEQEDAKESFYAPSTRKLLKEIKQPYVMPEEKKVKITGYKPKLPNKDKMRQLADSMNVPEKVTFAKAETGTWKAGELERGRKSSQAKKNEVLELLGQGDESWVYMTETSRKKSGKAMYENFTLMNEQGVGTYKISRKEPLRSDYVLFLEYQDGTKSTMLQSELNEKMADDSEKWRKDWKEPIKYEDQPAFKKVKKILSKEIPMKDIQPEFPEKAPPKLDPETQMHPDMFKRHDYFTKLDPDSAKTMAAAPTGDPKIDSEVEKAKKKPK